MIIKLASLPCKKRISYLCKKSKMTGIAISNRAFDKYFRFLRKLDNNSKKRLIIKLTESIETKEDRPFDLKSIYGTWEDSRDSDEIIKNIRDSRVNSREIEMFE
jgi:hypothetical protein